MYGSLVAVATAAALTACMVPLRTQLSAATTALVLVVPVVAGVSVGGFVAGLVATGTCFFVYDFVFLPPYYTLYVQRAEDWAALGVYAVVMVLEPGLLALPTPRGPNLSSGQPRCAGFSTCRSCWSVSCRRRSSSTRSSTR